MARKFTLPSFVGNAFKYLRVTADEKNVEWADVLGKGYLFAVTPSDLYEPQQADAGKIFYDDAGLDIQLQLLDTGSYEDGYEIGGQVYTQGKAVEILVDPGEQIIFGNSIVTSLYSTQRGSFVVLEKFTTGYWTVTAVQGKWSNGTTAATYEIYNGINRKQCVNSQVNITASTSLQNITGLKTYLAAGNYHMKLSLNANLTAAAMGIKMDIVYPDAAPASLRGWWRVFNSTNNGFQANVVIDGTPIGVATTPALGSNFIIEVDVFFSVTTPGFISVLGAQNVLNAGTIKFNSNGYMQIDQVISTQ